MQHKPIHSSMLASAGWEDNILEITFAKGNNTYRYYNVPVEEYKNLLAAESPGKYFTAFIKGKYQSLKVENNTPTYTDKNVAKPGTDNTWDDI